MSPEIRAPIARVRRAPRTSSRLTMSALTTSTFVTKSVAAKAMKAQRSRGALVVSNSGAGPKRVRASTRRAGGDRSRGIGDRVDAIARGVRAREDARADARVDLDG